MKLIAKIKKLIATIKTVLLKYDQISPIPVLYRIHNFKMTDEEIALFNKTVKSSKHYLEFGLGGSTIQALRKSKAQVYTMDSSADWIVRLREYRYIRLMEKQRLKIYFIDIGEIKKWGYPVDDTSKSKFPVYSSYILNQVKDLDIDTVLIDGRFRVACALYTILTFYHHESIKLLIHDFWNRSKYHILLDYLEEQDRADRLGLFIIKKGIDLDAVKKDYETYKFNPK